MGSLFLPPGSYGWCSFLHLLPMSLMAQLLLAAGLAQGLAAREKTNDTKTISTAHLVMTGSVWLFPSTWTVPPLYFSKLRGYHFGMNGTSCKSPGGGVTTSVQCGSCLALNVPSKSFSESCIWETTFSGGFVASSMWALVGSLSSWWQSPHGSTGWKAIRSSWDQGSGRTCTQGPVKQSLGFWDFIHQARDWKGVGTGDRSALPCKTSSKF